MHDPSTVICRVGRFTLWHVDPCTDGTDDSCGWFMRSRHGDKSILEEIRRRFRSDWDGLFFENGEPRFSTVATAVNLTYSVVWTMWRSYDKAMPWIERHYARIALLAENPQDSITDALTNRFGHSRGDSILHLSSILYAWVLREERPWYRHPRWHIWHWRFSPAE